MGMWLEAALGNKKVPETMELVAGSIGKLGLHGPASVAQHQHL
jgi:hypothetical protein